MKKLYNEVVDDILARVTILNDKFGNYENKEPFTWISIVGEDFGKLCKNSNKFSLKPAPKLEDKIYKSAINIASTCIKICVNILNNRTIECDKCGTQFNKNSAEVIVEDIEYGDIFDKLNSEYTKITKIACPNCKHKIQLSENKKIEHNKM